MGLVKFSSPRNPRSIEDERDWGYGFGLEFDDDAGSYVVGTDKPGRAISVGAIPVRPTARADRNSEWTFDRRVVALVANILERIQAGAYPRMGERFEMPTKEQADATFKRLGIPRDEQAAENLYWQCTTEGR